MDSSDFPVTVKRNQVVAAVLPVQEHCLPMSNLDLLLPPLDYGIFLCYKRRSTYADNLSSDDMAALLQKTLAQVLGSFYPLAGEILANRHGEPEILCNNRGVDFAHAYADVELEAVDLHRPDMSVHRKLVPVKERGVLAVQVTELKCGGVVLGCTIDRRAADAYSANMFLRAWADLARANCPIRYPSFARSLFNPRRPLHQHQHNSIDKFYVPRRHIPPPSSTDEHHLTSRIYCIRSVEIDRLQSQASNNDTNRTKIESFSAFLWQSLAAAVAEEHHSKTVKFGIVVDGRARLSTKTSSLESYFGNVLSVPYVEASVGELLGAPLNAVANMVHECVAEASAAEHFLRLIDWVEMQRPEGAVVRVYCEEKEEAAFVVSSGRRFPVEELDYGWGRPVFGSYYFPWGGKTGYVMPMPSATGNGDWIVYMHLTGKQLDLVERRAPHVFVPFNLIQ